MKFNKKWKIFLSIIGGTFLTTVPLATTLTSCSKTYNENKDDNDVNKPLNHSYEEWSENLQNENEPLFGTNINNWNKINNIYKTGNSDFLPFYSDDDLFAEKDAALEKSRHLLNTLTKDQLIDIFLISFNSSFYKNVVITNEEDMTTNYYTFNDPTYFKKPVYIEYKIKNGENIKSFIDIQDFEFDKENLIVSFNKIGINTTDFRSYEFIAKCGNLTKKFISKTPTILVTSEHLKFKIIPDAFPIDEKFIPIISMDDKVLDIKNIQSKFFAYNELKDQYFSTEFYNWLNEHNLVTDEFNNYIEDKGYSWKKIFYKKLINVFTYDGSSLGFKPGKLNDKYVISDYPILTDFWKNSIYKTVDNQSINNLYDTLIFGVGVDHNSNFINLEIPYISLLYLKFYNNSVTFIK